MVGLTSEGCAHRFAVEWGHGDAVRRGVFIVRRESNSAVTVLAGDRLFHGRHGFARFGVVESGDEIALECIGREVRVRAAGTVVGSLGGSELFGHLAAASDFYRSAPVGYSPSGRTGRLAGMEFRTTAWSIEPFDLTRAESSYFDDRVRFPADSIALDSALVMRNVPATWHPAATIDPRRPLFEMLTAA